MRKLTFYVLRLRFGIFFVFFAPYRKFAKKHVKVYAQTGNGYLYVLIFLPPKP